MAPMEGPSRDVIRSATVACCSSNRSAVSRLAAPACSASPSNGARTSLARSNACASGEKCRRVNPSQIRPGAKSRSGRRSLRTAEWPPPPGGPPPQLRVVAQCPLHPPRLEWPSIANPCRALRRAGAAKDQVVDRDAERHAASWPASATLRRRSSPRCTPRTDIGSPT